MTSSQVARFQSTVQSLSNKQIIAVRKIKHLRHNFDKTNLLYQPNSLHVNPYTLRAYEPHVLK